MDLTQVFRGRNVTSTRRAAVLAALVAVATLTLAACGGNDGNGSGATGSGTPSSGVGDLAGQSFVVTSVMRGSDAVPVVKGTTVTLAFGDDGQLSANAGCNTMSGKASVEGGTLVAGPLASTEMACSNAIMKQEQWWGSLLASSPGVAVDGTTLTLTNGDDVVTLEKQQPTPDASLTGTDWRLTSTMAQVSSQDGSVASIPKGVDATLLFGDDGKVQGSTGCNSVSGGYTTEGDQITFKRMITTLMACEGPRGDVERSVVPVLEGTVTYAIDGDQLTLTKGDAGLVYTATPGA